MLCNRGPAKFKLSPFHRRAAESYLLSHDTSVSDIVMIGLSFQNPKNFRTWEPFIFWNARFFFWYWTVEQFLNATFFRQISLPKTIEFSFVISNAVVETVRVRINAIRFTFFEADARSFEIRITAWGNQNRWHFSHGFAQTEIVSQNLQHKPWVFWDWSVPSQPWLSLKTQTTIEPIGTINLFLIFAQICSHQIGLEESI